MAVSIRFFGVVTNSNGTLVQGTVKVATTTTPAGVSSPLSTIEAFNVTVPVATGDTITLTVDTGHTFTGSTVMSTAPIAGQMIDLSCDIGSGAMSAFERFV